MAQRTAKLTPFGRQVLVQRVRERGWTPAAAAEAASVSRATVYKCLRRFDEEGQAGLEDRSSRPRRHPTALPETEVRRILKARRDHKSGPHDLAGKLGMPRSTIYAVLRRHGLSRLDYIDRPSGVTIRRYAAARPGELMHLDVKKLAKIPEGGGHRMLGRQGHRYRGGGYEFVHTMLDSCSRVCYSEILPDQKGPTCSQFLLDAAGWFADQGVRIERVMTDEAMNYTRSGVFKDAVAAIGAKHRTTGPYNPKANGKVERFHLTLIREWAYKRLYKTNDARRGAFSGWLAYYNLRRPHTALEGLSPMVVLVNKLRGNHS